MKKFVVGMMVKYGWLAVLMLGGLISAKLGVLAAVIGFIAWLLGWTGVKCMTVGACMVVGGAVAVVVGNILAWRKVSKGMSEMVREGGVVDVAFAEASQPGGTFDKLKKAADRFGQP